MDAPPAPPARRLNSTLGAFFSRFIALPSRLLDCVIVFLAASMYSHFACCVLVRVVARAAALRKLKRRRVASAVIALARLKHAQRVSNMPTTSCAAASSNEQPRGEDDADEKVCRICLMGEEDGPLVQKCGCRGSASWVHEECLASWRRTSEKYDAAFRCGQCNDKYRDALSIELLREKLRTLRENGDQYCEETVEAINILGTELAQHTEHLPEAITLAREVLQIRREALGDRHPYTITAIYNLSGYLLDSGDLEAAQPLFCEGLASLP